MRNASLYFPFYYFLYFRMAIALIPFSVPFAAEIEGQEKSQPAKVVTDPEGHRICDEEFSLLRDDSENKRVALSVFFSDDIVEAMGGAAAFVELRLAYSAGQAARGYRFGKFRMHKQNYEQFVALQKSKETYIEFPSQFTHLSLFWEGAQIYDGAGLCTLPEWDLSQKTPGRFDAWCHRKSENYILLTEAVASLFSDDEYCVYLVMNGIKCPRNSCSSQRAKQ